MRGYIGIDMGTSSVKAVLIDEAGAVIRHARENYAVSSPEKGWTEIDPEIWYEKTLAAIENLLNGFDAGCIKAICFTGQMHSTVFMDECGAPLYPAILWNDTRSAGSIPFLSDAAAKTAEVPYISKLISTGSPAANLFWFKNNCGELFSRMRHFLIGPDYLVYRFTGKMGTDYCEASTSSLFDLEKKTWSHEMAGIIGLKESVFPQVFGSEVSAGCVLPELSEKFGLNKDTAVLRGTGDNAAAALTTGCLLPGQTVISLGTSGVLMFSRGEVDFSKKGKNVLFALNAEKPVCLVQGAVQSVGSTIDWWSAQIRGRASYDDFLFSENDETETPVLFFPHLNGEKTLYRNSSLRGAFLGLGTDTTAKEMALAVMEGICFAFRELAEKMSGEETDRIGVIGGGSANSFWVQLLSDTLRREIYCLPDMNGAAYGAASLAADGIENNELISRTIENTWNSAKVFRPNTKREVYLEPKYKRYRQLYAMISNI